MMERQKEIMDRTRLQPIYFQYMETKGADEGEVARYYEKLYQLLREFSWREQNSIQCAVNELGAEIEKMAFLDGVCTGAKLMMDLLK